MVYGSKQASKHTHACAQCSHASVGLAQARSNESLLHYAIHGVTYVRKLMTEFKKTNFGGACTDADVTLNEHCNHCDVFNL